MNEQSLGPAHALEDLKAGEPCIVVLDCNGAMFVRPMTDDDAVTSLRGR